MGVTTTKTNKPLNPRGNDQSPKGYNRAALYSGKALDFDGVNDYVEVADNASLDFTTAMSAFCYMRVDSLSTGGAVEYAFSKYDYGNNNRSWLLGQNDNKLIAVLSKSGFSGSTNTKDRFSATFENTNEYYFVGFTFESNVLKLYVNGQEVETGNTNDAEINSIYSGSADVCVGSGQFNGGAVAFLDGKVANARAFNVALTAAQVADLYNNPEKVVPTGVDNTALKLWLPMQEGAGTTAYDGSGNGNHGTISGATWTHGIGAPVSQTAVISWNKGTNLLNSSEQFSSAAWAKLNSLPSSEETGVTAPDGNGSVTTRFTFSSTNHIIRQYIPDYGGNQTSAGVWVYIENKGTGGTELYMDWGDGTGKVFDVAGFSLNTWHKLEFEDITRGAFDFFDISACPFCTAPNGLQSRFWGAHLNLGTTLGPYVRTGATAQTSDVLLPQGLTSGRDITGVNLFENVRKQGALNLDGNSWAEVHDNSSLDITDAITLEAWVYWDDSVSHGFLGKWDYSSGKASYLILKISETKFRFYVSSTGSNASLIENGTTITNGWNHIVGVYDGTNIKCYLNGSVDGSAAYSDGLFPNDLNLEIGKYASAKYPNNIAQPRIYNRALTAEEVQRNYDAGKNTYTNS